MHLVSTSIATLARLLPLRKLSGVFHARARAVAGLTRTFLLAAVFLAVFPASAVAEVDDSHHTFKFEWYPAVEGDDITVTITQKVDGKWAILYWTQDSSAANAATENVDYTPHKWTVTDWPLVKFSGKGDKQTITVKTIADNVDESDEEIYLKLYSGEILPAPEIATLKLKILEPAAVTVNDASAAEGGSMTFTVTLDKAVSGGLTVTPSFTDVTAAKRTDYTENTTALRFTGTAGETQSFTVSTTEDAAVEADETFKVSLSVSNNTTSVKASDTGTGTITNDDSAAVTIADARAEEGDWITFTVTLDKAVQNGLKVTPSFTGGTATKGTDYTANTAALTFIGTAGETESFTVITTEDTDDESNETFTVGLAVSNAPSGVTATDTATGTIIDDDGNRSPVVTDPGDKAYVQGESITAFDITVTDPDGDKMTVTVTGLPSGLSYANGQVSGTVAQTAAVKDYTATISADDGSNPAETESFTVKVIQGAIPGTPTVTRTKFSKPNSPALDVTWTAPATDSRQTLTGYKARYRKKGDASWTAYSGTLGAAATMFYLAGLEAGATYEFQVRAQTDIVPAGSWSATGEGTANSPPVINKSPHSRFDVEEPSDRIVTWSLEEVFRDPDGDTMYAAGRAEYPGVLRVWAENGTGVRYRGLRLRHVNFGTSEVNYTASDEYGGATTLTRVVTVGQKQTRSIREKSAAGTLVGNPVTAVTPAGETLSYTLAGAPADTGHFQINSATGQISVKQGADIDYEARASYAGEVKYTTRAGAGAGAIDLTINVTDVPPGTVDAPTVTRTEFSEPTAPALDVTWTAPDTEGQTLTGYKAQYRKKGAASWTAYSGALGATATTFNLAGLDAGATYEAQVRAVISGSGDGPWSATGEGTANTPPAATSVAFSGGTFPVGTIADYKEAGQGAVGVLFSDADSDTLTYTAAAEKPALLGVSLTGDAGEAHLRVTLLNEGSSKLTYTATDAYGGSVTRTTTIGITAKTSRSIAENSPAGTAVGAPVTGTPYDGEALSYTLTGNAADSGLFVIDSATGQISVKQGATLDYETDDSYRETETWNGQVISKFYRGKVNYTVDDHDSTIDVKILITDVETVAPGAPTLTRTEFSEPTAPALDVTWTAPAADDTITGYQAQYRKKAAAGADPASWTAYSGTLGATATTFNLAGLEAGATYEAQVRIVTSEDGDRPWSATGEGTANTPPAATSTSFSGGTFPVGSTADYKESGQGAVGVLFSDADSDTLTYTAAAEKPALLGVSLTGEAGEAHLRVTLLNQGSSKLTYTATDAYGGSVTRTATIGITAKTSRSIAENSPAGTAVGAPVTGTPYDGEALSYTLTGNAADSGLFVIASSTGQISVKQGATLDYETDDGYRETETSNGQVISKFYRGKVNYTVDGNASAIEVLIILTDVETGAPGAPTLTRTEFSEPTAPALDVTWTAPATDDETISGYKAQYRKKAAAGADPASWTAYSGTLGASATTFNLAGLEAGATYEAQVLAVTSEEGDGSWSDIGEGTANRPPAATSASFTGGTFPVGTIADYRETGQGAVGVLFSDADSDTLTYSAAAQHPALLGVSLTGAAGEAQLRVTLLNQGSSELTYTASDAYGGSVTRTTTIDITAKTSRSIAENSAAGTAVGAPVTGTPYDGEALSYTLTGSAADSGLFTIDSSTGQISVATGATLDYETDDIHREIETSNGQVISKFYRGKVKYTVDGNPAEIDVIIKVTDVETGAPAAPTVTRTEFSEPTAPALDVTWTAPDTDGQAISGYKAQYRRKAAAGEDAAAWTAYSGTLGASATTFNLANLEAGATYEAQVRAVISEEGDGPWSATGEGTANRPPAATSVAFNGGTFPVGTIADYRETGQGAVGVLFSDADGDTLTYSAAAQHPALLGVSLTGAAGEAHLRVTLLNQGSSMVIYTATDAYGGWVDRTTTIGITAEVSRSIAENSAAGTAVGAPVTGTPYDGEALSYSLTGNAADSGLFTINSSTGQISVASGATLDYETDDIHREIETSNGQVFSKFYRGKVNYTVDGNASAIEVNIVLTDVNEADSSVTIADASAAEGDAISFTVTLSKAVSGGLKVTPSFTDVTATKGTDYTENTAALTFTGTAGETQTFTVSTTEDTDKEHHETFTVGLAVSGTTAEVTATDTATGTITNDDGALAAVTIADASANEGDAITFTVTLDKAVTGGLTVTPSFTDVTAAKGTDYTENTTALTFTGTAGETKTFTVATTEDTDVEADETFTVGLAVSGTTAEVTATDTATGTITNDDGSAAVTIEDASANEGDDITFTVTLDKAVDGGLKVTPSFTDVTATEGTDYTENTSALSFTGTAGETQSFTVSTTEDTDDEDAETFTVSLSVSGTSAPVTATDTATGTVHSVLLKSPSDDPAVTIADASANEGDDLTFTVTLDKVVAGGLTVTPSFTDVTATKGTDYTENTTALTFTGTAGETQSFTVSTTEDTAVEADETFTVSLAVSGASAEVTATDTATGTITNDDGALAAVTVADVSAAEGDSLTFTVTLDNAVTGGLTVTPSFTDGTATEGTDYTENTTALTFTGTAGETKTFTVATTEDTDVEADETFTVGLAVSGTTAEVTATDTATGTITNDDGSAEVTIGDASANEGDDITFTVTLDKAVDGGLKVTPSFTDGTAIEGTDYTENTAALSFTGTAGEQKTFTVATTDDTDKEHHETFTVDLAVSETTAAVTATDTATGTITDDDGALAAVTIADAEADEGDAITFTVTLDNAVTGGLTVTPSFTDVTAAEGTDYTENTAALTFTGTAGETKTFTVATTDDTAVEPDETFTVGLAVSGATAEVTATDTATGTITNDDGSAEVTIGDASANEGDDITFTVTLDKAVDGGLKVTPSFTDGTAIEGTDYTENTAALSFTGTAGEQKTFTMATTEDTDKEHHETFTVGLAVSETTAAVTSTDTATGTITNDDGALAAVTIADASADEGDSITFTVTLDNAVSGGLKVTPSFTDVTAAEGTDYTENTAALTFTGTAGETKTFTVATTDDTAVEPDETFTVGLAVSGATAEVTATDTATGTITNDDGSAEVTIGDAGANEGDDITFTVTLDKAVDGGLKVTPSFTDGTAIEGTDYTENTSALSFTGTAGETQTFTVETTEDTDKEHHETFTVGLTVSETTAEVTATDTATGTITDDDGALAAVTIADASAEEGDSITFTVTLDNAVTGGLTVTPSFTDVTAAEGTDYTENTAALTFTGTAGETKTFTVATTDDTAVEPDETFTVGLAVSEATATVTATDTATGTITNDDGSAEVTIEDAGANEGDDITFTVTLDKAVDGGLTVTPSFTDVTATKGTDYTENTAALSFTGTAGEQKTFTVATTEDTDKEHHETFTVGLAVSETTAAVTSTDTATGTITNDDGALAAVTIADAEADEGDSITFTVTLDNAVSGGLKVTPSFTDVTAAEGTDYTENTAALTFAGNAGETKTFTVATTEDTAVEPNETFTVSLSVSEATAEVTSTDTATGTITNDDGSAEVTIGDASANEGDDITFTVTLDKAVDGGLTVTPSFTDGTAIEGTDYTENTAALSFTGTAGEQKTFTVATTEDTDKEHHETFTVDLAVSETTAEVTSTDTATGTITDDDGALAAVTIADAEADEGDAITFTVTLDNAVTGGLTVTPSFTDVTATKGTDYTENTTALTFTGTAGETKTFTVATTDDTAVEPDETFKVGLAVSGATAEVTATDTATGTITNDDGSAEVTIGDASANEGDDITFTVTLDKAVDGGLTVTPSFTDGTAIEGTDYTENTAALSFTGTAGEQKTFTVATTDDTDKEHHETFKVGLAVSETTAAVTSTDTATGTITDDDGALAAVTIEDVSAAEGDSLTFTVTLDNAVTGGLTVTPSFTDVTATKGTDYTENTTALTFTGTAGETKTFTVATTDDTAVEPDETFKVGLAVSGATAEVTSTDTATGTITNDDGSAEVTIGDASANEGDDITFTVTLDKAVDGGLTVTPSFTDGTAIEGTDYTENTAALSFTGTAGEQKTFTVATTDDTDKEHHETFKVGLAVSETTAAVTSTDTATGTITDDDGALAAVTIEDVSAAEGDSLTFTVTLDNAVTGGLTVTPSFTDVTAAEGTDYTENTSALTFAGNAGETQSFTVATTEDAAVEPDETFTVSLSVSEATATVTATDTATGTITNDDGSAEVTIGDAEAEEGDAITFTVTLDKAVSGGLTVTPSFTDGTATEGTDYTENTAGLTFNGTAGEQKTFTVATTDDTDKEHHETFKVGLAVSGTSASVTATDTGTGTITNDDGALAAVTIADASANEGDSITFTVTLDNAVTGGLKVTPSFTDVTATEGTDYTENTTALTFAGTAGETQTFTVATTEDTDVEPNETFTVGLAVSETTATVTATDTASGTITDDDSAAVTIEDASANEGDAITFTVTLDKAVTGGLKVTPSFTDGTATGGTDYTENTSALTFAGTKGETQSFTVATTEDTDVEPNETFKVGLAVSGTTATVTATDTASGTVNDDDSAAVTIEDASANEGDAITFTVTLDKAVSGGLKVTPSFTDVTATKGTDYTENTTALTFAGTAGETQSFTVATAEDTDVEPNETFTVGLAVSGTTATVTATDTASGTITDDDSSAVTIGDASAAEGDSLTFTVTLNKAVSGGLKVTPSFTDVTATKGTDYTENTTALTFAGTAGETQSFTVATTEDTDKEHHETFKVGLAVSGTSATVTSTDTATGTITNDDGALAEVTIADASANEGDAITFTVTLDNAVTGGLTVTPSFTDVTATKGTDYTGNTSALTFSGTAGETKTFTVATTEDTAVEPDETFTVGLAVSGTTAEVTATDTATGTITNDDGSAAVTIGDASANEGDAITFTVRLDKAVSGGLTVTPSFTDVTATKGTDYTENTAALSFTGTAGEQKTFTVATTDDTDKEHHETFKVGLAVSETTAEVTATDTATGTITDDDGALAAVTIADASADEGDSITFTVTLDNAVTGGLKVTPSFTDVTAAEGTDYTENTSALTFAGNAGETQSFTVATTEDAAVEPNETFTVSLSVSEATAEVTATDTATGTITNDDGSAEVTIGDAEAEEGDAITFTVTLDKAVSGGLTVTPSFTDVTATKGTDYTENTTALTFTGTAGEQKTFTVATTEDSDKEHHETFTVGLAVSGTSATVTATDTATGTITNDDGALAAVTIADASADEGDSLTFTVRLDKAVSGGLTVTPSFTDVTATEGTDYTENTTALSFTGTAGETKTFTVTTTEDAAVEPDETFTVGLAVSETSAEVTASDTATGTITNDDGSAAVTIGDASANEGDAITFTVTLDKAVSGGLTVTPSFTDVTATKGTDYTENTTGLSFTGTAGEQKTFTVPTTEDSDKEHHETFTVSLAVSETTATVTATDTATGTITNDDGALAAVTVADVSAAEGDSLTFTVRLDKAVSGGLTVTPSFTDVTATEGTDYTENTTALSFTGTAGETKTFTVTTTEDTAVEPDETFTVGLAVSETSAEVTASDTATGTITNDDGSAAVTIGDASANEGDAITFTVRLDKAVSGGLTVTPSFTDVTATKGTDYTENTTALTFTGTAGEQKTFTVATTEDSDKEHHETFTVALAVSETSATVTATDEATGTITDDDGALAAVTIADASADEGDSLTFTVRLDKAVSGGLTVTPSFTDVTATKGTDYTENTTALTFTGTAGETQTFTVATTEDSDVEEDETFTVSLAVTATTAAVTATDTATGTITNDDYERGGVTPAVTIADASANEGDSITFTVTLDNAVSGGLTVTPSFTDVTATEGTDYTENTSGLTFTGTANETKTFTVATTEDTDDETNETFTVSLTVSGNSETVTATDTATGTIIDDDGNVSPVITDPGDKSYAQGEAITAFGITVTDADGDPVTVTVTGLPSGLSYASDQVSGTVSASAAVQAYTVTINADDGVNVAVEETFTITVTEEGASNTPPVITDPGDKTYEQGEAITAFDITVTDADSDTVTVTVTGLPSGLSYANGQVSGTVSASAAVEAHTVTISADDGINPAVTGTFTITVVALGTPQVTIADASAGEGDPVTFTVTLNKAVSGGLTVTPSFTDGTAEKDADYTENTAALTFEGTAGETRTLTVETVEDEVVEDDETFTVVLIVSDTPVTVTATDTATGVITNDDEGGTGAGATVTIADASAAEGEDLAFTVTLNQAVQGGLTVTPSFTDVTATSGTDYTANTDALSFTGTVGETQTLTVATAEDEVVEDDETFTVSLAVSDAPSGVTVGDPATGTITDNDEGGTGADATVTIADASAAEGEDLTFTVTLNRAVQGGLTVTPSFTDVTATSGTDYTANTDALSFTGTVGETQTLTVATAEDEVVEEDETFAVSLAVSDAPSGVTVGDPATGTITDDDEGGTDANETVTTTDARAAEGEALSFTVRLNRAVPGGLTVTPRFTDGTATANRDYTPNTAALRFAGTLGERQAFRVLTIEDAVVEGDETFTVSLSVSGAPPGLTVGGSATGTIEDDDGALSAVTISDADALEGDSMTFTMTLNRAVPGGLTVTPRFTDVTAAAGSDYTPNTAALRFAGTLGEQRTISVETIEDAVAEDDETFTVRLDMTDAPEGVTAGRPATGTITDDDGGAIGGRSGANNKQPNAMDDYITISQGGTATTLSNGNSADHLKNLEADPFGSQEDFLDDADGLWDERSYLTTLLETSVLANDSDIEDDISQLSVQLVDDVSHGDLTLNSDGTFVYAHDGSKAGEDRFTYRVKDSGGALSEVAVVTIRIVGVNAGPESETIPDQTLLLGRNGTVNLSNYFSDPDGDPLSYHARATDGSGTVRVNVSSSEVTLTPVAVNVTRVTVTARDPGGLSVEQTFGVTVESIAGRNERLLEFSMAAFGRTVASQAVDAIGGRFDTSLRESQASVAGQGLDFASSSDEQQGRTERFLQVVGSLLAGRGCYPGSHSLAGMTAGRLAPVQAGSAGWPAGGRTGFSGGGLAGAGGAGRFSGGGMGYSGGAGGYSGGGCRAGAGGMGNFGGAGGYSGGGMGNFGGAGGFSGSGMGNFGGASGFSGSGMGNFGGASGFSGGGMGYSGGGMGGFGHHPGGDLMRGSSFQLALGQQGGSEGDSREPGEQGEQAGGWMLWGQGVRSDFTGRPQADLGLDGRVGAAYVGADHRWGSKALLGVAASHSIGSLDYTNGGNEASELEVGARLTSVHPYARWSPRKGLDLWGLMGFGRGSADLEVAGDSVEMDIDMRMAAVGVRNELTRLGAVDLALKADAFTVSIGSEAVEGVRAVNGDARRARLMLEGSTDWSLSSNTRLIPRVQLGARLDGGDADTGLGADLAGGVSVDNRRLGLEVEARGHWLVAHQARNFKERGASLAVRLDPGSDRKGWGFSFAPLWGNPGGGADALWRSEGMLDNRHRGDRSEAVGWRPNRAQADLSYGLSARGGRGRLIPFARLQQEIAGSPRLGGGLYFDVLSTPDVPSAMPTDGLRLELFGDYRHRRPGSAGGLFAPQDAAQAGSSAGKVDYRFGARLALIF